MKSCATCHWARFSRTATGRLKRTVHGVCAFPKLSLPLVPECASLTVLALNHRIGIWPEMGTKCACHELAVTE